MAKFNINYAILAILTLLVATQVNVTAEKQGDEGDELCLKSEKLTKIRFYAHEVVGGPNATVYEVARSAISTDEMTSFGKINVVDNVITVGPDANSEKLGKVQGILTSADMETTAIAMNVNVVFTSGEYNGSTLSIAGRNLVQNRWSHLAVVGGSGVFRFTRGYAVFGVYSSRVEDSVYYGIFEYSISATFCH